MNYLVISDTHSIGSKLINLISRYPGYQIIHLGDAQDDLSFLKKMNAIVVRGNCDFFRFDLRKNAYYSWTFV